MITNNDSILMLIAIILAIKDCSGTNHKNELRQIKNELSNISTNLKNIEKENKK